MTEETTPPEIAEAVFGNHLIIRPQKIRVGWEEAFISMAEHHDDILLDDVSTTEWDDVQWQ